MRARAGLHGRRLLYDAVFLVSNILEMIGMIRHILVCESRTVLRMMLIAAGLADNVPAAGARAEAA